MLPFNFTESKVIIMTKYYILDLASKVDNYFIELARIFGTTSEQVKWVFVLFIALGFYGILLRIAWIDRLRRK